MKLNVGCGNKPKKGYINIDIRKLKGVNVICNVMQLCFKDNTIEELVAESVLEHCPRLDIKTILQHWIDILEPGGKLIIVCPNIKLLATNYLRGKLSTERFVRQMYGDQGYPENTHKCGFDPEYLTLLLKQCNIEESRIIDTELNANNLLIEGYKQ